MIKRVDQLTVGGARVFMRVDFNLPHDGEKILDDTRIRETLPTIRYLLEHKARVVLASHLGRPNGRDMNESLEPVAARLAEILGRDVIFPEDCAGDAVRKLAHDLREGDLLLLENLRFHPEEEAGEERFASLLAQLGDLYITDAFGTLHRAHASTAGMVKHFREKGIGFLVQKELEFLGKLTKDPERPFVAVLGGAKVSDKIGLIENLVSKVDTILLGGGLAYTFLKAAGREIGKSKLEEGKIHLAQKILEKARDHGVSILLPSDHRVGIPEGKEARGMRLVERLGTDDCALDIGPETAQRFSEILRKAKTIFWNGPLGVFETPAFAEGTFEVARAIAGSGAFSVVGGGESLAAVRQAGLEGKITHLSTGGGASLEYLEGKDLPGLKVLEH